MTVLTFPFFISHGLANSRDTGEYEKLPVEIVHERAGRKIGPPLMTAAPAHKEAAGAGAPCRIVPGEGIETFPGQALAHRLTDIIRRRGDSPFLLEQQPSDTDLLAGLGGPALPEKMEERGAGR